LLMVLPLHEPHPVAVRRRVQAVRRVRAARRRHGQEERLHRRLARRPDREQVVLRVRVPVRAGQVARGAAT